MFEKVASALNILGEVGRLPKASLHFMQDINPNEVISTYRDFTKQHPRYKIFKNKSLGVALIDLTQFSTQDEYIESIRRNGDVLRLAKKAQALGYTVTQIDRNDFVDDIHEIHTSIEIRQGRPMDKTYTEKQLLYKNEPNFKYYGVLNNSGKLMSYANLGFYGNFAAFDRLIGYRNNDGIMHLMITRIISELIDEGKTKYVMYDTFFGAQPSFKAFKKRFGFKPYRANYSIE